MKSGIDSLFLLCLIAPCWVTAQTPAVEPVSRLDAAAYQRLVDENLDLRREKDKLEAEAGALRRRNAALLVDLQDMERRKNQLTVLMSQLKTPDESRAETERLQAEKRVLILEVERVNKALAQAAAPVSNSVPAMAPAPGSDLFRKVEKENADLRQELALMRESVQKESALHSDLSKSESQLKVDVSRLTEANRKAESELDSGRRREAALKKALEVQARKAFEADRMAQDIKARKEEDDRRRQEAAAEAALAAKKQAEPAVPESVRVVGAQTVSVADLLDSARRSLAARKPGDAEDAYLKALKLEPGNPRISYNLGVLYGDYLDNPKKAARYYRHYLKLDPRASDAATVRSWIVELEARSKW